MYKNIIFDLGNVVLDYNPKGYLRNKLKNEEKVNFAFENIFNSKEWPMLDRGAITEEEAIKNIISRNINESEIIKFAFEDWYNLLTPIEATVELMKELKSEGYKLYYLSNFHSKAFKVMLEKYDFFKLFDGGIVSFKEKLLKPEVEIYNKILDKYNLKAKESIFIDDILENVQGANAVGIKAIQFIDINKLRKELEESDVLNN